MQVSSFGFKSYRSFGEAGASINDISRLNLIVGKNNCGKSNILRFIRGLAKISAAFPYSPDVDRHLGRESPPTAFFEFEGQQLLKFPEARAIDKLTLHVELIDWKPIGALGGLDGLNESQLMAIYAAAANVHWNSNPGRNKILQMFTTHFAPAIRQLVASSFSKVLFIPEYRRITAEKPSKHDGSFDGSEIIRQLRDMQIPARGQEAHRETFQQIQAFTRSVLNDSTLKIEIPIKVDELLVDMKGQRLPLASFGTGIHHTILLCAAAAMHRDAVFCIEEPEIHLHPQLQRSLLTFFASTSNTYFVSTHSNVFVDSETPHTIVSVRRSETSSTATTAKSPREIREMLADLGYRASDLLQANVVVWVEGPSDRIYLNRWLSLLDPTLRENIDYSVMYYGGACGANLSASEECPISPEFVHLLSINRNSVVIMDRDAGPLKAYKERIAEEMTHGLSWITAGREIENYLTPQLVNRTLLRRYGITTPFALGPNESIQKAFDRIPLSPQDRKIRYDAGKTAWARELAKDMNAEDLDTLDLRERLATLQAFIRRCRTLDEPAT